jgi:hypothetical protein
MAYYNTCPECGCSLDPGEKCDCREEREKLRERFSRHITVNRETGQMVFKFECKEE